LVELRTGGETTVIPVSALPYLGHGLDPGLFQPSALARAESGGRLPVRVRYAGPAPSLPGLTVTSAGSGMADGYLTRAGARTFGAALARWPAAGHAADRDGGHGMLAGISVALAGAGPAAAVLSAMRYPEQLTMNLTPGPSLTWNTQYILSGKDFDFSGGQSAQSQVFLPGQRLTDDWGAYPLHPVPFVKLGQVAFARPVTVSASRAGDVLGLAMTTFGDNTPGHDGGAANPPFKATGSYRIDQNGTRIAGGALPHFAGFAHVAATLSPARSLIRFVLNAAEPASLNPLSTSNRTVWTWWSAHESGATLPPGWLCTVKANRSCAAQPLLMLRYGVVGLGLDGSASPGQQVIRLSVGHLQLARPAPITRAALSVSFDGGKTWQAARMAGSKGAYAAVFPRPGRGHGEPSGHRIRRSGRRGHPDHQRRLPDRNVTLIHWPGASRRQSVRVLQHQVADLRERGLDVLASATADGTVGLDDHRPAGGRGAGIGDFEHRLGHLVAALGQVVAEVSAPGCEEVGPERLEVVRHPRKQGPHHPPDVTGSERVRRLVGELDRGPGDTRLLADLPLDQRIAVVDHMGLGLRRQQDLVKRGCHGSVLLLFIGALPVGSRTHTRVSPARSRWPGFAHIGARLSYRARGRSVIGTS
jgi:hypothetical protein